MLHIIGNNMGMEGFWMGQMLEAGMIESQVGSYVGEKRLIEKLVNVGKLYLTLISSGRSRRAYSRRQRRHSGILCPGRIGMLVGGGKETREFDGKPCIIGRELRAGVSRIKA